MFKVINSQLELFKFIEDEKEKSRNRAPNELGADDPSTGHQAMVEKVT